MRPWPLAPARLAAPPAAGGFPSPLRGGDRGGGSRAGERFCDAPPLRAALPPRGAEGGGCEAPWVQAALGAVARRALAVGQQHRDRRVDLHALGALPPPAAADLALVDRLHLHGRLVGLDLGDDVAGLDVWPSFTSHLASLPSSMVGDSAGIRISVGMLCVGVGWVRALAHDPTRLEAPLRCWVCASLAQPATQLCARTLPQGSDPRHTISVGVHLDLRRAMRASGVSPS